MTQEQKNQYHKSVEENIRKHGYHSTFVAAQETPSFCYTTGLHKNYHIPELFISSLPPNLSFGIIHNYLEKFKETESIPLNKKLDDLIDRFQVYLIEVTIEKLSEYALSSIKYYNGHEFQSLQLIYPDTKGLFPGEIGYDYDQEILGQLVD